MPKDTLFTMQTVPLKFGWGSTHEVGAEAQSLGIHRCLLVTDPRLKALGLADEVAGLLRNARVDTEVYDRVRCEPNDASWNEATGFAGEGRYDGFVAVGGGSVMDTAKAINLLVTYPADLMEYVNQPIGLGKPVPGPLKPLIAIPTTAGTASETTGTAILDVASAHVKTGMFHRHLRPALALCDPENTLTMPPMITASTGLDVLSHALESCLMVPYNEREAPDSPADRKPYCGSNPVSDVWCSAALRLVTRYLERAVADGSDREARFNMLLASTMAGYGFGNAGVHVPHAMGYPIASMIREYVPPDYDADHPIVPHGISVMLGAPAVFRFTSTTMQQRHLEAAELLGCDTSEASPAEAGELIAGRLIGLMRQFGFPNGLSGLGYTEADIPALVDGTMKQQRILVLCPSRLTEADVVELFRGAMRYW